MLTSPGSWLKSMLEIFAPRGHLKNGRTFKPHTFPQVIAWVALFSERSDAVTRLMYDRKPTGEKSIWKLSFTSSECNRRDVRGLL